jgi:putative ABC transport system permease protein
MDHRRGRRVALLGHDVARAAFPHGALGQRFRLDYSWFEVVGVLAQRATIGGDLPIDPAVYDRAVVVPYTTAIEELEPAPIYGELALITVAAGSTEGTLAVKRALGPLFRQLHRGVKDFELIAPEEILRQRQSARGVLNVVLVCIAAISLLVGGIGVMNIMLANIMERIGEIGLRRAVGARRRDIRNQFLVEAVTICVVGGLLGILLGYTISFSVSFFVDLPIAFAWVSMVLAFGLSTLIGVVFGYVPAIRAANINPIEALHSE